MIKSTDGRDVMALIDQLVTSSVLTHLHKDVLSKTDYALFSAGARVISSLTSRTLELSPTSLHRRFLAFVTGHGYAIGRPPVTALHHDVQNGFCWPFEGSQGQLGVMLAAPVKVESVTVDHVPKEVAMDVRSAPKDMEVWALVEGEQNVRKLKEWRERKREAAREQGQEEEEEMMPYPPSLPLQPEYIRLANFTYDLDGPSHIQNFPVEKDIQELGLDFGVVVLMVKSNWGQTGFTCLYRFRVHGTRLEAPGLATSEGAETTATESNP
jgi:SUN domain-containing protein 1/2